MVSNTDPPQVRTVASPIARNQARHRISCYGVWERSVCAAFIEESRVKFTSAPQARQEIRHRISCCGA